MTVVHFQEYCEVYISSIFKIHRWNNRLKNIIFILAIYWQGTHKDKCWKVHRMMAGHRLAEPKTAYPGYRGGAVPSSLPRRGAGECQLLVNIIILFLYLYHICYIIYSKIYLSSTIEINNEIFLYPEPYWGIILCY